MTRTVLPYLGRASEAPASLATSPLEERLLYCVDKVLSEWAQLTPAPQGCLGERPEAGLMVKSATFGGRMMGVLSVAAPQSLARHMAIASTGDLDNGAYYRQALLALSLLLRDAVLKDALGQDPQESLPQGSQLLALESLTQRAPLASLRVLVLGLPLEIRLWVD